MVIETTFRRQRRADMSLGALLISVALAATRVGATATASPAASACAPPSPTGTFTGSATSKQAGKLTLTLTLTCAHGRYSGSLRTPVGPFAITRGSFDGSTLLLQFAAKGAGGILNATVTPGRIDGTFTLGSDSGAVALRASAAKAPPAIPTLHLSTAQWRDDLAALSRGLPVLHPDPFRFISAGAFTEEVAQLDRALADLNGDETYFGFDRIANSIGDAHTYVALPPDNANLPIDIQRFDGAYRVTDASTPHAAAVGARVLAIDGVPIETVRRRLVAITPAPETMLLRESRIEGFMTVGMLLRGAGITKTRNVADYTLLRDGGTPFTLAVNAVPPGARIHYLHAWRKTPLRASRPSEGFWYVYLPASRAVYCRFASYDRIAQNALALLDFVRRKQPAKLVVDMRANGGGDFNDGLNDLILPIAALPQINRAGRLFVLVDRNTFSAAMANAAQFREYTHALLVGEVIGERPNSYEEPREFSLPNSGLIVRYSTKFYAFVRSGPDEVVPDEIVVPTWAQFVAGEDPALTWALERR
jgi:hypothetical protein